MTTEEELNRYRLVNSCETIEALQATILEFADEYGMIQGRTRPFIAEKMAAMAKCYYNDTTDSYSPNVITREFGLRQQAMYLKYYK